MNGFGDREKGFEAKFSHDEDIKFRITTRRNKLLGLWAAKAFGLSDAAADAYAKDVVAADFDRPGDDDLIEKVLKDAKARGVALDAHAIKRELAALTEIARTQVMTETK